MSTNEEKEPHYLKQELYRLVQSDVRIFEFLQSGSLDGIWYWDLENPEDEWMSNRFWETFGYDPNRMPHKAAAWQHMINEEDLALAFQNFNEHCADEDHPYDQIVRYEHKDGSTVWVRCRGMAVRDSDGKPIRMIGAHTDITAVKQAEQELSVKNAKLEDLNNQLTHFAYAASHDLQSPIRALTGLLDVLDEDHKNQLDTEGQRVLKMAVGAAERADSLVKEILDYSSSGETWQEAVTVDCNQILDTIKLDLAHEINESGVQLNVAPLPSVCAQPIQLKRLFQNLISNALKYRDSTQGEIPVISVQGTANKDAVSFSVSDNGIGIPEAHLQSIFEAFTQLNNKSVYGGVGLGLSICQRIIQSHRGEIWVESLPGKGSTFYFSLPVASFDKDAV